MRLLSEVAATRGDSLSPHLLQVIDTVSHDRIRGEKDLMHRVTSVSQTRGSVVDHQ